MSNSTHTVSKSSRKGSKMDALTKPQSLAMSEYSLQKDTPTHIRAWLQSLVLASHVNPFLLPADRKPKMTLEICGLPPSMLYAELDQDTASWKMCQDSYRGSTGTLKRFSKTWPRAGICLLYTSDAADDLLCVDRYSDPNPSNPLTLVSAKS